MTVTAYGYDDRPERFVWIFYRGDSYRETFTLGQGTDEDIAAGTDSPIDTTGWTGLAQIRTPDGATVLATMAVTTGGGTAADEITLTLSPADTAALPVSAQLPVLLNDGTWDESNATRVGRADVQLTDDTGYVDTWIVGNVYVADDTSRTA